MGLIIFIVYMFFCFLVAWFGREISMGFWGMLVLSVVLTPLIAAILFVLFRRPKSNNKVVYKYKVSDLTNLEDLDLK